MTFFTQKNTSDNLYNPKEFKNMFILKSTWTPPLPACTSITLSCLERVNSELVLNNIKYRKSEFLSYYTKSNLTMEERKSISFLRDNPDIIIKKADKGGSIVLMDKSLYNKEIYRQLLDGKYYIPIPHSVSSDNCMKINGIISQMRLNGYISHKQLLYFTNNRDIKDRKFYILPKIHKPRASWPEPYMPSGRPIVSCCGTELHAVGKLVDYYLQPFCVKQPSYTRDTYHFIDKIRNQVVDSSYYLVTGDITSLYTNMDHNLIIDVITKLFIKYPYIKRPDIYILQLLQLTISGNDFIFDGQYYLQILGMAMGNPCSPATANLFLEDFDMAAMGYEMAIWYYNRFLDDTFFVWPGSIGDLIIFESYLNTIIPNIKISFNFSFFEINFLDVVIFKHITDKVCYLYTKPYFKPTDTHQLIHKKSFHPRHVFEGVIRSQFLRFKRLSSMHIHYVESTDVVIGALCARGYSKRCLRKCKNEIWYNQVYVNSAKQLTSKTVLPLILDYNMIGIQTASIYKRIFNNNHMFDDTKFVTAYCINKNLGTLLSKSNK